MLQVKYEVAGKRANKLLRPIGILLPEGKDERLLLGGSPDVSARGLMGDGTRTDRSLLGAGETVLGNLPGGAAKEMRDAAAATDLLTRSSDLENAGGSFSVGAEAQGEFASRPDVVVRELDMLLEEVDEELKWQGRNNRAAEALEYSSQPVVEILEGKVASETMLLGQLKSMAGNVLQAGVLGEINEAIDACEASIRRLESMASNMKELYGTSLTFAKYARDRCVAFFWCENLVGVSLSRPHLI